MIKNKPGLGFSPREAAETSSISLTTSHVSANSNSLAPLLPHVVLEIPLTLCILAPLHRQGRFQVSITGWLDERTFQNTSLVGSLRRQRIEWDSLQNDAISCPPQGESNRPRHPNVSRISSGTLFLGPPQCPR